MSQENVEVLRRWVDAFNRRNLDDYDDLFTADLEWFPAFPGTVEEVGHLGREGIERYFGEISDTWEEIRNVEEYRDLGDRVLALGRIVGRGRGCGASVNAPIGGIYDFREGKMSRGRVYLDHGETLRAAGLEE